MTLDRIALVTGANRGLGLGIARALATDGLVVLVGARSSRDARVTAGTLTADGAEAHPVVIDLDDRRSVRAAAAAVDRDHPRLDLLVNNAGILPEAREESSRVDLDADRLDATLRTNVVGTAAVIEAMLPLLTRSPRGRIVNVSSALGSMAQQADARQPASQQVVPAYQASKAALNSLTISLGKLLAGTSVTVDAVCPGFVQTDIHPAANRAQATLSPDEAGRFVADVAAMPGEAAARFLDRDGAVAW